MSYVAYIANSGALWAEKAPRLRHLDIELTERCQNVCRHCYINRPAGDEQARRRELDTAAWLELFRQAVALGVLSVRFTGGEPLLREDFPELYLAIRRLGVKVKLFTNARAITPELAALFRRIPPLVEMEVSVYGMSAESYDAVTGVSGSFDEFRRGVALLLDNNIPFLVKGALLPQNRHEIAEFDAWAATIPWMMMHKPTYALFFQHRARRDSAAANRRIDSLRLPPEEGLAIMRRDLELYEKDLRGFCASQLRIPGDTLFSCGAAHGGGGCIDAYGVLQPCLTLRHPDWTYNLRQGTLADGLDALLTRVRETRASNPQYFQRCARCFIKALCQQCPAISWLEHGTLDTPVEYYCQVAHAQARDLGLMTAEEYAWEIDEENVKERISRLQEAEAMP